MVILEPQHRDIIIQLIKDHPSKQPWVDKQILSKLQDDADDKAVMAACSHIKGTYTGHQTCCTKCGAYYEEGMGLNWKLDPPADTPYQEFVKALDADE